MLLLGYVMFSSVTRTPDPAKKPALLEQIVDHFLDKSLSTLTFRSLAAALDVSTFTPVYHFGSRSQLVRDIMETIANRERGFETTVEIEAIDLDSYIAALAHTFQITLLPRNRALQRLEFEAQILESLTEQGTTRAAQERLQELAVRTLIALGLSPVDALLESRLLIDTFYGIQFGLVVTGDEAQARASFERAARNHRERISELTA